jgi:hypothetical protein
MWLSLSGRILVTQFYIAAQALDWSFSVRKTRIR